MRDPIRENRDKLSNQFALFWLRGPAHVRAGDTIIDLSVLDDLDFGAVIADRGATPAADLSQMLSLLKVPWQPVDSALQIDDYSFYLALLSPNKTRLATREWFLASLGTLKVSLAEFLDRTRMVSAQGDSPRPIPVRAIVEAIASGNPNLTRMLLRSAYMGVPPSRSLAIEAGRRLNDLLANEQSKRQRQLTRSRDQATVWHDDWPQALAAAIRLSWFFGSEEEDNMQSVNPLYESQAYHCGRLLAVLEEAQQRYHFEQSGERLKTTVVTRSYGGAVTAPAKRFGSLIRLATVAHLPKAGSRVRHEVEAISSMLAQLGGFPQTLSAGQQAEFGLGFFHERAAIRAWWPSRDESPEEEFSADDSEAGDGE